MVMEQGTVNASYDSLSEIYDELSAGRMEYCSGIDNQIVKFYKHGNWLDIGSGDGKRISRLKERVKCNSVTCIEPSEQMYKKLKQHTDLHSLNCDVQTNLNYKHQFHTISALWNVLGHIPTEEKLDNAIKNIYKYLKTDGVFLFDINHRHNIKEYKLNAIGRIFKDLFMFERMNGDVITNRNIGSNSINMYGHLFTAREIKNVLRKNGFRKVKLLGINYQNGTEELFKYGGQLFIIARK